MAMPFTHLGLSVNRRHFTIGLQMAIVSSQAHGASHVFDFFLFFHHVDNWMRRVGIDFYRMGTVQMQHILGKLYTSHLHAQANAKERDVVFTHKTDGVNFSIDAAASKTGCDENPVYAGQLFLSIFRRQIFRREVLYFSLTFIDGAGMNK